MTSSPDTATLPLPERMLVYLEGLPPSAERFTAPVRHPVLDQKGIQFHPLVMAVQAGTTVDFPNRDNLYHNVFSYSPAGEFDLGRYPMNDSRSVTFDRPGIVRVYCDIHANMRATIVVLPHPYFARPDDQGNFTIARVPAGTYTLVVWLDRDVIDRKTVTVRAGEHTSIAITY